MEEILVKAPVTSNWKDASWLPVSKEATANYMNGLRKKIQQKRANQLHQLPITPEERIDLLPVMREFYDLIYNDSLIRMNFVKMIDQVPSYYKEKGPDGEYLHGYYLQSIDEMILLINHIIRTAPEYNDTELVGFPINTILNWNMGVPAGAAAFRNEKVNQMFQKILNDWTQYLDSDQSLYVFNKSESGWLCEEALEKLKMEQYLDVRELHAFKEGWEHPNFPYQSWNDFFTRHFKNDDQRRIDRDRNVIVSACDSQLYNTQFNARMEDWFWLKSQPYSLRDMLANETGNLSGEAKIRSDEEHFHNYIQPFEGGSVYQAFLSAFKYHRWHSPVDGEVKKAYIKQGTYYSATQSEGMDQGSPDQSQGYIAHTAARAIIFIEARDPRIGLVCVMPIGMSEVSSCILSVKEGDRIAKGEELGYFQFGGSTHCVIFRKEVIEKFIPQKDENVKMGSPIATIK